MPTEATKPSMAQVVQAQRRIHLALDKGQQPSPADVEIIGGKDQLASLLASRSEMKETINKLTEQEISQKRLENQEPIKLKVSEPSGDTSQASAGVATEKRRRTKSEREYEDFIAHRLGPIMCFILFLAIRDWERASFYAFSPDECDRMSEPLSTVLAKLEELFKVPRWVHSLVTTSDDTITLLFVFAEYFQRTGILDAILPVFSIPKKETEKKHAKQGRKNDAVTPLNIEPIQQQQQGYAGIANGRSPVIPGTQFGSQWLAD